MELNLKAVVGSNIRRLRKISGLTQAELGELAQVAQNYVSALERADEDVNPTLEVLDRIARSLGTDVPSLMVLPTDTPRIAQEGPFAA